MKKIKIKSLVFMLLIILQFLIFYSISSASATVVTLVQGNFYYSGNNVNSGSVTLTNYPTYGNLLVLQVSIANSGVSNGGVSSITESNTTGWTNALRYYYTTNYARVEIWYCIVNGTYFGKQITVNLNVTVNYVLQFDVQEYTGLGLYITVDKIATQGVTSTSPVGYTGNLTQTTYADELVIGCLATYGGTATQYATITTPQNGFTLMDGEYGAYQSGYGAFAVFRYFASSLNTWWSGGAYGGVANKAMAGAIVAFKPSGGASFNNISISNTESGVNTIFSINASKITNNLTPNGGYVFSWNNGSGFNNDTWLSFSDSSWNWCNTTKMINSALGSTISWMIYANDSSNYWSQLSPTQTFTVQATVTFYLSSGGILVKNGVIITNVSSTTYMSPTNIVMLSIVNSTIAFKSFNWTNNISSTTTNNYTYVVANKTDFWCYMYNPLDLLTNANTTNSKVFNGYSYYNNNGILQIGNFSFNGNATINTVLSNQTFYSLSDTLLMGNYTVISATPNLSDYVTKTDSQKNSVVLAIIASCLIVLLMPILMIKVIRRKRN